MADQPVTHTPSTVGHGCDVRPVQPPTVTDVWTAEQRRNSHPAWRFRRGARRGFGEPARVPIEQATLEMCADQTDTGIVSVVAKAVGSRRTTPQRLRVAALNAPSLKSRSLILEILTDVASGIESPLEHRYLIDVERAHGPLSVNDKSRSAAGHEATSATSSSRCSSSWMAASGMRGSRLGATCSATTSMQLPRS